MKSVMFLSIAFLSVQAVYAQTVKDTGKYIVYVGETMFAEETYSTKKAADDATRTESLVTANGKFTKFVTTIKNSSPSEFFIETDGKQVLTVTLDPLKTKIAIAGQPDKTFKTSSSVILENAVWSQYLDLFAQYDQKRGGAQKFIALLPTQALELNLTLARLGIGDFKTKTQSASFQKYLLSSGDGLRIEIWTDNQGVPLFFDIPSQQVTVVRGGFEFLREASGSAKPAETKNFIGEFTSEEVAFPNGEITLAGTLTIPKNASARVPAAIIITGSGGDDRDGSRLNNLYRRIAESLSQAGVAVLRVDDRGNGKSTVIKEKAAGTSYRDLISDSRAAFDYLVARQEIDKTKIAFVGHSEGAETALTLAAEDKRAAAVVILAGSSRPVNEIVLEQELFQRALQGTVDVADQSKVMPLAQALNKQFEAAKSPVNAADPKLAWFREHLSGNPSLLAAKVQCPVLIVQGERDALVLSYHALKLATALTSAGNKRVSLRILPDLSHVFAPVGGAKEETGNQSSELLKVLQNWMNATLVK